jgi:hypothetical protein
MRIAKKSVRLVIALLLCAFLHSAHARGPSTPQERAQIIARIRMLEQDPLSADANAARTSLLEWAIELPEIRFHRCKELLGSGLANYPYAREFNDQAVLSGVAFTLERQDKMRDQVAAYIAGVEGALRMYEALLRLNPNASSAFLDDLIARRERGELAAYLTTIATERCETSNQMLIAIAVASVFDLAIGALIGWLFSRRLKHSPAVQDRSPNFARTAKWIVFACAAYYATAIATLHFLESDYDPRYRFLSEYQWSQHGWLMYTTFFVLAFATLLAALCLQRVHPASRTSLVGFGLLILGAIGITIAGIFSGFPLHDIGSAIGLPSVAIATLFYSVSFRSSAKRHSLFWPSLLISLAMLIAIVTMAAGVGMPGLQQRVFLSLFLLWLVIVAQWFSRERAAL